MSMNCAKSDWADYRRQLSRWGRSLLLGLAVGLPTLTAIAPPGLSQQPATCKPPAANEYLLLVVTKTAESQQKLRRTLPGNVDATICSYLQDVVTRIGGFTNLEAASSWARYVNESVGLPAFVARPPVSPPTSPTEPNVGYNPKLLGAGFAVLVDYLNRPELAKQIVQIVGRDVGLASYGQRPYLLVTFTSDPTVATSALRTLSDRGFWTTLVDGRRVVLLRNAVVRPGN